MPCPFRRELEGWWGGGDGRGGTLSAPTALAEERRLNCVTSAAGGRLRAKLSPLIVRSLSIASRRTDTPSFFALATVCCGVGGDSVPVCAIPERALLCWARPPAHFHYPRDDVLARGASAGGCMPQVRCSRGNRCTGRAGGVCQVGVPSTGEEPRSCTREPPPGPKRGLTTRRKGLFLGTLVTLLPPVLP